MFEQIPLMLAQVDPPAGPTTPTGAVEEAAPQIYNAPTEGQPAPTNTTTESGANPGGTGQTAPPPPGPGGNMIWVLLLGVMFIFIFSQFFGQRKEKKKRAEMLAAMTKGKKVQTIGGIIGTVVEVRDNEVVVKVDENANTRIKFARSAIQTVLEDKAE